MSTGTRQLVYLYVGSADVGRDLGFYRDQLGGEVVWRSEGFGAEVAAVRLGDGPLVLLADHRDAPSVLPIWAVDDLDGEVSQLRATGWTGDPRRGRGARRARVWSSSTRAATRSPSSSASAPA